MRAGQDVEEEVPRINVEIPRCVAQLGSELYFAKLPNFLSVETRYITPALLHSHFVFDLGKCQGKCHGVQCIVLPTSTSAVKLVVSRLNYLGNG